MKKSLLILMTLALSIGQMWAQKSLEDVTVELDGGTSKDYDGIKFEPTISSIKDAEQADLQPGTDYEAILTYGDNTDVADDSYVEITGMGDYVGSTKRIPLTINKKDIASLTFAITNSTTSYSGISQAAEISLTNAGDVANVTTDDLDVYYGEVTDAPTNVKIESGAVAPYKVTLQAKSGGNFTGKTDAEVDFTITQLSISTLTFSIDNNNIEYNGEPQAAEISLTNASAVANVTIEDLDVYYGEVTDAPTNASTTAIVLKAKTGGNFQGETSSVNFTITKKELTAEDVDIDGEFVFTGVEIPVPDDLAVTVTGLTKTTDFTVAKTSGANNTTVADGMKITVTLTDSELANNYTFTGDANFIDITEAIIPAKIGDVSFTAADGEYTNTDVTTTITAAMLDEVDLKTTYSGDYAIVEDSYENNTGAGEASVKVKAVEGGNLTGDPVTVKFKITKALSHADINISLPSLVYAGKEFVDEDIKSVIVKDGASKVLVEGTDYTIKSITVTKGDVKVGEEGEATVFIEAIADGFYTGSTEQENVKFKVVGAATYNTVTLDITDGIDVVDYTSGSYTIESDGYIYLQFRPETEGGVVVLEVDGEEVEYKASAGYSSYIVTMNEKDHTVKLYLKAYTVTFPSYEGITFEGEGTAEYGKPYTFRFTLADDIDPADIQVYVNDVLVEPDPVRATSYTVTIDEVTGPINIRIEGATVGIGELSENRVYSQDGALVVETISPQMVQIYNMTGKQQFARTVNGQEVITLSKGIYIVRVGKEVQKVVVR